jgi:hypothetical protein
MTRSLRNNVEVASWGGIARRNVLLCSVESQAAVQYEVAAGEVFGRCGRVDRSIKLSGRRSRAGIARPAQRSIPCRLDNGLAALAR